MPYNQIDIYIRKYVTPDDKQYNTCPTQMHNIVIFFCDIYFFYSGTLAIVHINYKRFMLIIAHHVEQEKTNVFLSLK